MLEGQCLTYTKQINYMSITYRLHNVIYMFFNFTYITLLLCELGWHENKRRERQAVAIFRLIPPEEQEMSR